MTDLLQILTIGGGTVFLGASAILIIRAYFLSRFTFSESEIQNAYKIRAKFEKEKRIKEIKEAIKEYKDEL